MSDRTPAERSMDDLNRQLRDLLAIKSPTSPELHDLHWHVLRNRLTDILADAMGPR